MPKPITTRCRNRDDAIFDVLTMTQQPASPPDVYSIAVMTQSSNRAITHKLLWEELIHVTDILGRSLCLCKQCVNTGSSPKAFIIYGTCPNMPKQITTRCRRRDDAIFDDATTSITNRCLKHRRDDAIFK
ncbi:hypothetical protein DAPPUDRAFT_116443 [Daphnia pulex]|uniref:Uncharacterized protein n=1 Tax=Daphnia pulex TaxID=6669 RepID=E9HPE5_DAPPU|nr:hypothetical protein DAPPUDRAFT_116443 [Daphnia pulex]|eukprot:EFX66387.1 hypothetical protein DAPPUDRAFT_116443 [Daphnia pulex]